jgi:uncharacterized membrane protein YdfJ with MMPL/SSD domain
VATAAATSADVFERSAEDRRSATRVEVRLAAVVQLLLYLRIACAFNSPQ